MKTINCILLIIFIIGCKKEKIEPPPFINNGLNVHYSEGSGWTGWEYDLNIDSTGVMTVYEIKHLPQISERNKRCVLLAEEVDSLKYDIETLSAIKLQDYGFGPDKPTDLPVSTFRYSLNTSSDTSSIYFPKEGEIPAEFVKVLNRIYKLRNKYDNK